MKYTTEMAPCGMTYIPSFMKTGIDIQAILRFCPSNFKAVLLVLMGGIYEVDH
jgi:hypothetical protein